MEEPIHVPASTRSDRISSLVLTLVLALVAILHVVGGMAGLAVVYVVATGACGWGVRRGFRVAGRGILLDVEGVGPAEDGVRLWTLPWGDYGGFRNARITLWERFLRPERSGYEILDRSGQPVFVAPVPLGGSSNGQSRAGLSMLRAHLPEGGADPTRPVYAPPRLQTAALGFLVAAVGLTLMRFGLADPLSPLFAWGLVGGLAGGTGLVVGSLETFRLVRWRRGWRPAAELPSPEEGPTAELHLIRDGGKPLALEEGRRYRTVDPERRRRDLHLRAMFSRSAWIGVFLAGQSFYGLFVEPRAWPLLLGSVALWSFVSAVCFNTGKTEQALLAAVDDVLWVEDGHLIAVRAQGDPLVLPLPSSTDRQAMARKSWFGATDVWRLPDGSRYAVDRTRLYVAPNGIND